MKEASLYFPKSVVRGIYAPMKILIHKFIIEKQTIQFLGCPQRHDFCPDCALCKIKPLHALLARNIVLALTDKLQSANRRTWLFLCVISECLCLGAVSYTHLVVIDTAAKTFFHIIIIFVPPPFYSIVYVF